MQYTIRKNDRRLVGRVTLAGSKSISNRALIIRALCGEDFPIARLANARDTVLLDALLRSDAPVRDAEAAGTTFRFLTAYLAMQPGEQVLTGTARMQQRPIGVLVEALRALGAEINYLNQEGYPPLRIGAPAGFAQARYQLSIPADTSSQYISALLMIAPVLPKGLELTLEGKVVSRSYIEMTLRQMAYFGISYEWEGAVIRVPPQAYVPRPFTVEADWSAASYYYTMAAFADELDLELGGVFADSVQGDAAMVGMMAKLGVETEYTAQGLRLRKSGRPAAPVLEQDFILCPDVAQTMAVTCAGMGIHGLFTGLETLRIKETDRIAALKTELAKVGVTMAKLPPHFSKKSGQEYHSIDGQAEVSGCPVFDTYEDHRMAMAFAPLAMLGEIAVADPAVVGKSYPDFWADIRGLGFEVT